MLKNSKSYSSLMKSFAKKTLKSLNLEIHRTRRVRNMKVSAKASLSNRFSNYHLGCGGVVANDFLNIDANMSSFTKKSGVAVKVSEPNDCYVLAHDLRDGIPAAPSSLQVIYHSHFLEHLSNRESVNFLRDCLKSLAKGGTMRFAIPDLELWCKEYLSDKSDFFDWYRGAYLGNWWDKIHTNGMAFSGMLYNFGHKMAYDYETLSIRLLDIGFVDVQRKEWGVSDRVPALSILEGTDSERRVESLVIECRKLSLHGKVDAP